MKTSTWVTVACVVVSAVLVLLMFGLITVPTTETAPSTSVESSVSGSGAKQIAADERDGAAEKVKITPAEDLIEAQNKQEEDPAPAEDLIEN